MSAPLFILLVLPETRRSKLPPNDAPSRPDDASVQ